MSEPATLPTLPQVGPRILTQEEKRARRIFATCRWAGVIAVTEMADGFEAAMRVVNDGPATFLPDEQDWESINPTATIAIGYIEGTTP